MAFRYSEAVRNAGLDARIKAIGPRPILKLYAGVSAMTAGEPADELVSMTLPDTWMGKAKAGAVEKTGEWKGRAGAEGKAKSFRIYDRSGDTCHIEGQIPDDMKLDNPHLAPDQSVTITEFTIRSGNG